MTRDRSEIGSAEPSDGEFVILEAVWKLEPITAREVTEVVVAERGWAYSTVKTMLDRMVGKGLLRTNKVGNIYQYRSSVNRSDVARLGWRRLVDRVFGGSAIPALQFVTSDTKLTPAQRRELSQLLDGSSDSKERGDGDA